jgi:hypothetical protein
MTKRRRLTAPIIAVILAVISLVVLVSGYASAAPPECIAPSPRPVPVKTLNIYNNSSIPIYPVLETAKQNLLDEDGNPYDRWLQAEFDPTPGRYASTYLYRTYVHPQRGLLPGQSVTVTVPFYTQLETSPCPFALDQYVNWWRALRVYIYDDPGAVANAYDGDTNPQNAVPISPPGVVPSCQGCNPLPSCQGCSTPLVVYRIQTGGDQHGVSLPPGDPSQLLEFTFALVTVAPAPLAINRAFVDYDISSVDQVYLPVAMDPLDNPYIGYIGSVLGRGRGSSHTSGGFGGILLQFQQDFGWPQYKWPAYVTYQKNVRLPGTFNVMNEIANPGSPPPFVPDGPALKQLPVIQAMETLWDNCCGAGWPQLSPSCVTPPSTPAPRSTTVCPKMVMVAQLFEANYANYASLCQAAGGQPRALDRDFMLAQVYGWVPFNECSPAVDNQLKDTPGYVDAYPAVANAFVELQYQSSADATTAFGPFNRYVELIHSEKYLHIGEYAFSIDDAAGNMEEVGAGLNITLGGPRGLGNPNPYDPWRYFLLGVGSAPPTLTWTKYRICTQADPSTCPSTAPDRDFVISGESAGLIGYAAIKIGAVPCPCVIILQDSAGTLYKVLVKNLPAPPPTHPLNQQGDPPTAIDASWVAKVGEAYANVSCADTATPFQWCAGLVPSTDPGSFPPRTAIYHISTGPPVVPQPGIQFGPGEVTGTLSPDGSSVTVTWPAAITQLPSGSPVAYQLTLWDLAGCPLAGAACDGHSSSPLSGTCVDTATACKVPFAQTVPPLAAANLRSLSVVAIDQAHPSAQASIQGNFTPPSTGPAPLFGEIRSGTATGVGRGPGAVTISGVFTFAGSLDLAARGATVTILNGLNEIGGRGDLVLDRQLALGADARNTSRTARFKTASGGTPEASVTIGSRGRGQYTLLLDIANATIHPPATCPQPQLVTSIEIDDGTNPPVVLGIDRPWECQPRGGRVEYLKAR